MILCLVYLLWVMLPLSSSLQCSDKCWFVYHPSDGRSLHQDVVQVPPNKKITGVITIDTDVLWQNIGEYHDPRVIKLQFMKTDREQPLALAINDRPLHDTQLVIWGEINGQGERTYGDPLNMITLFPNSNVRIQITDHSNIMSEQSYHVYVNGQHWSYNYLSPDKWERFENMGLNTTTKIKIADPINWTRYNFISVCSDPKPALCDAEHVVTINAVLGDNYTLACSGSGAPYLSSRWDKETYRPTFETNEEVIDKITPDNFIRSTLKIRNFTMDHIGTWTCTISNLNFSETVQKTYQFHYSEPVNLMNRPSIETYNPSSGNTSFEWKVEGWPLDNIHLKCDITSPGTYEIRQETPPYQVRAPRILTITLTLTSETTQDLINCRLLNLNEVFIDSVVISKVGYNCKIGQYGEGTCCLDCPRGETSLPSSTECFPVKFSSCPQDQFGEGDNCTICPWGSVTFPKDTAVKEHDCIKVKSICSPGEYGYLLSGCQACSPRSTSLRGTVKLEDCINVTNFCGKIGYWGEKDNCQRCPGNHTSDKEAAKLQDCYPVTSSCPAGYFGIDTNCIRCPDGMTSHSQTVEGYFTNQKSEFYGFFVGLLIVVFLIRVFRILSLLV